ncbi:biopolymer transporter ExbD [Alkalilimnicola ehrlichii]|uniref:Biopolymer transporter ExbD n=1 Tax=Alkalilimnicola ehrlichii TaxID=351052 RepID=A0A3E0WP83_9GAMM|nr:MotA/TolQ/ExbB proton channel family protein [Alkalilimnicola ehrlichii]RFA27971.1 biopolymer transporter ExbD [Alkalilimnicola ehrlichii]RFA34618.1 biopolymer transporter ExbD [Alkalilimnicola ehrlichii]
MFLIESTMYELTKVFLAPVLLIILGLFGYAFYALGGFALEALQRRRGRHTPALISHWRRHPDTELADLELLILRWLEPLRIGSRTAPMLGLIATMIPMGPALLALADGNSRGISENLVIAFAAVIIALIAASLCFFILTVRRRWLLNELRTIEHELARAPTAAAEPLPAVRTVANN